MQADLFSLVGDTDIGGTSLVPPADRPSLLALSRGLWASVEGSFLLLVPLFLVHNGGGPLISGLKMEIVTMVLIKEDLIESLLLSRMM